MTNGQRLYQAHQAVFLGTHEDQGGDKWTGLSAADKVKWEVLACHAQLAP